MGITIIEHKDLFCNGSISKKNTTQSRNVSIERKKMKSNLWKCKNQKVCLKHLFSMILFYYIIIFMFRFFNVMPLSSRTESTFKFTYIIITDSITTTKAALSNVWSSQT